MQLEIGKVYDGKVKGIAQYGAFVEIEGAGTGMVHISEIANTFVKDVKDYLKENQEVKVKVLSISDDGKIGLSIKKAAENQNEQQQPRVPKPRPERKPNVWEPKKKPPMSELGFEEMLTRFKQNSEEKSVHSKETPNARTVQEENNNIEYPMLLSIGYFSFPRFLKKAWQKLLLRCSFNRYIFIRLDRQLNLCLKNLAKAFTSLFI